MAVCQTDRYRGLAVLVRSYRKHSNSDGYFILMSANLFASRRYRQ